MQSRVAIFGSGGQLGVELCREFGRRGWEVVRFDRQSLDVTDAGLVETAIAKADPALVINSAAYNQVDVAEKEPLAAFQANALAVRNLAMACRQADAQLIHFSTDYVFDGTKGSPYVETDPTHPLGAYAVSKLSGELYAQAYLDKALIIRTSGVFGPGGLFTPRGNFVELMLRLAGSSSPIRVVEDHVASPTYAPLLAERTAQLFERNCTGVFHVGGGPADLLVRIRAHDFRTGRPGTRVEADQRTRVPYSRTPAEILGSLEQQDGELRCYSNAAASRRGRNVLGGSQERHDASFGVA